MSPAERRNVILVVLDSARSDLWRKNSPNFSSFTETGMRFEMRARIEALREGRPLDGVVMGIRHRERPVEGVRATPNVILVIDRSGSMNEDYDGGDFDTFNERRREPWASMAPSGSRTVLVGNGVAAPAGVTDTFRLPSAPPSGADTQATTRVPEAVERNMGVAPFSVSCETTRAAVKSPSVASGSR